MKSDDSSPSNIEKELAFEQFAIALAASQRRQLGASLPPLPVMIERAQQWFSAEAAQLRSTVCTSVSSLLPQLKSTEAQLFSAVADCVQTAYGEKFPVTQLTRLVLIVGIERFCADPESLSLGQK